MFNIWKTLALFSSLCLLLDAHRLIRIADVQENIKTTSANFLPDLVSTVTGSVVSQSDIPTTTPVIKPTNNSIAVPKSVPSASSTAIPNNNPSDIQSAIPVEFFEKPELQMAQIVRK